MSADAIATLQKLWEKLHFSTVRRVITREPEDILSISLGKPLGEYPNGTPMFNGSEYTSLKRRADVPEADRWRMQVSWRHYYGFTVDDVYFQQPDFRLMDFDIDLTCTWGDRFGNHKFGQSRLPEAGQLVCGEVITTQRGKRFSRWFPCDEAFRTLVLAVRGELDLTEDELGRRLLTEDSHDTLWAVARLALFDNVQAFVDQVELAKIRQNHWNDPDWQAPEKYRHPAAGRPYGKHGYTVLPDGMYLPLGTPQYLHTLTYQLGQPQWWEEFLRLTQEKCLDHFHPEMGGLCEACVHENIKRGEMWDTEYGWHDCQFPYSKSATRLRSSHSQ